MNEPTKHNYDIKTSRAADPKMPRDKRLELLAFDLHNAVLALHDKPAELSACANCRELAEYLDKAGWGLTK